MGHIIGALSWACIIHCIQEMYTKYLSGKELIDINFLYLSIYGTNKRKVCVSCVHKHISYLKLNSQRVSNIPFFQ